MNSVSRLSVVAATVAAFAVAAPGTAAAQASLDSLYQAAKAAGETEVVIAGPPSPPLRAEIDKTFGKRFPDVSIVYSGLTGNAIVNKMKAEARANIFSTDVVMTGTTTGANLLKPAKMIQDIDPLVVVPEARDPKKWLGGKLGWADDEREVLAMLAIITPGAAVNTDLVKPGEILSDADLLNPKWKGKIVANNPLEPGSANVVFRRLYDLHGEDYIKKLLVDQEVAIIKDVRQPTDFVVKGRYAIALGASPSILNSFMAKGIKNLGVDQNIEWKDRGGVSAGFGGLMIPNKVPHPAAMKLFVNWLLTQEGQTALSRGLVYPSRRTDVDLDEVPKYLKPQPGRDYIDVYTEAHNAHPNQQKMIDFIKSLNVVK